ncbi:MAG: RNA-binding S4 domain-containing protein [Bacteroidaceae bacterium]|nr:RNA-binding S4 domain-containing protein [Bacteroidaceae bacterium]MBQ8695106.1 RNA-binding S4 domain-containing protein [Bacteroidaceae bacterium]MBR3940836.1 RNA-binding S4 domain-containing protein [Bacteroidaceae bacterium]
MAEQARIDKWLWAVRIYKTRSIAAEACKKGHVSIGDRTAKPAHNIRVGDIVNVKKAPITYSFRVLKCAENRVGAKLVPELMENITSQEQYEILEMSRISGFVDRARGTGRPTKKERRDLDQFVEEGYGMEFEEFDFDEL